MMKQAILVLGMHRSGTSALTRVLSLLGAALPNNVLGSAPGNETGHWEPERLMVLHDQMLLEAGSRWDDWRAFDPAALGVERLAYYKAEITRLIAEEYGDAPFFVLKEPRICRFVSLYADILTSMKIDVRYLLTMRNPQAVMASLAARNGFTPGYAALLWLRHIIDSEHATRENPRAFLSYEELMRDWSTGIKKSAHALAISWPRSLKEATPEIGEYLSPEYQHHFADEAQLLADERVTQWVKDAYIALKALEKDRDTKAAFAALDRIKAEFDAVAPIFGETFYAELSAQNRMAANALADLQKITDERTTRIIQLSATPQQQNAAIESTLIHKNTESQQLAEQRTDEIGRLSNEILRHQAMSAQAQMENAALADKIRNIAEQYADEVRRLRNKNEISNQTIDNLSNEIARLNEQVSSLDAGLKEEQTKLLTVTKSNSWRLTLPLREARRWISSPKQQAKRYTKGTLRIAKQMHQALPSSLRTKTKHRQLIAKIFPRTPPASEKANALFQKIDGLKRLLMADAFNAGRGSARYVYRRLPLSPHAKLRLRSFILKHFSSFWIQTGKRQPAYTIHSMRESLFFPGATIQQIIRYLNEPAHSDDAAQWRYSRFMSYIWHSRLDLQHVFKLDTEAGRESFAKWYVISARHEYRLTHAAYPVYLLNELVQKAESRIKLIAAELLAAYATNQQIESADSPSAVLTSDQPFEFGANFIGYARGEFGMGEHVRMVAHACATSDVPFTIIDFEEGGFHGKKDDSVAQWISNEQKYGVNIFHINADVFPSLFFHFTPRFFDNHTNIGYWAWELENCPEEFDLALNMVDEVWSISEFTKNAFMQRSKVPVINMPLAVSLPKIKRSYSKRDFDLPNDEFTFLFSFDAASYLDRKNPIGAVRAFKSAFRNPRQKTRLVLKTMNVPENDPLWDELIAEIDRDPRIQIIEKRMSRDEILGLTNVCDAFVSLHRAEGFGRCIAESMLAGKPVIVTNYSGSRDFANEATACAVDYRLISVAEGSYPFWRNQVWAEPDYQHAGWFMRKLVEDDKYREYIAAAGQSFIRENFNEQAIGSRYKKRLEEISERKRKIDSAQIKLTEEAKTQKGDVSITCNIDLPRRESLNEPTVREIFDLSGWAIAPAGIACVEISVDGKYLNSAHYGILRPDIGNLQPDIRDSDRSGFFSKIDSTALIDGIHSVEVTVHDRSGNSASWNIKIRVNNSRSAYGDWLVRNSPESLDSKKSIRAIIDSMKTCPLFSIGMVVDAKTKDSSIRDTFKSLNNQIYENWELTICTQPSEADRILTIARDQGATKIRVLSDDSCSLPTIVADFNGTYAGFINAGDILDSRALLAFAGSYSKNPLLDLIYSDEDALLNGRRITPVFKPDWSPTLFKETNYIGRPWFAKTISIVRALDDIDADTTDIESNILARLDKTPQNTAHIPMVLYTRNADMQTTDSIIFSAKSPAQIARGQIAQGLNFDVTRIEPSVSIIIPTRISTPKIVEKCLSSLFGRTLYDRFQVIVIANDVGEDDDKLKFLKRWPIKILKWKNAFNWSAVNNFGAKHSTDDYLLFMNDDIEICERDWLMAMVNAAQDPGIGVVGATLRYPNGTIQHAGLSLTPHAGGANHLYRFLVGNEEGLPRWISMDRECSTVTGACLLTRASKFHEVGGFDENLPLVCNDTDYCLKIAKHGYRTVISGNAKLIHHEGISRGGLSETHDIELFHQRWGDLLRRGDPYLNPNFLTTTEEWAINPQAQGLLLARTNWLLDMHPE